MYSITILNFVERSRPSSAEIVSLNSDSIAPACFTMSPYPLEIEMLQLGTLIDGTVLGCGGRISG
jgi:hypothetical protein